MTGELNLYQIFRAARKSRHKDTKLILGPYFLDAYNVCN